MSPDVFDQILSPSQRRGLEYPGRHPRDDLRERAVRRLGRLPSARSLRLDEVRATINFHPDRPAADGRTVIEHLWAEGRYRNQFEVGITNGDPTAFPGGRRHQRESEMFGSAYDDSEAAERPKYGALDLLHSPSGGWPRFGSSFLVLSPRVLERSTFLIGSGLSPRSWVGGLSAIESLLAAPRERDVRGSHRSWRSDGWVELQIHGPVRLHEDVTAIVIDDSFRDTSTGAFASKTAQRYGVPLEWASPLRSDSRLWRIPGARGVPQAIVTQGLFRDRRCSAAEIGRVLYAEFDATRDIVPMDAATRDGVAKYFWNRILLADDVSERWAGI